MAQDKFATAVNCMDGRTQLPVMEYLKDKYGVDHVDAVTEPGPIKALAEGDDHKTLESIKRRIDISVNKHGSSVIALVGHHDCAGNPVDRSIQETQLKKSVEKIRSWNYDVEIICLYVNEDWSVEVLE